MINSQSTFLWEGRIHLGDEPGIYGNASYTGLSMEFPFTVKPFDLSKSTIDTLQLELITENVNVFAGYPGHRIIIRAYQPDPQPGKPYQWKESIIKNTDRILHYATSTIVNLPLQGDVFNNYISVAVEVESDIKPGLYDDFLLTGINYTTTNQTCYLLFGFRD